MRAIAIAVALTACMSPDPQQLAQRYESAKFCPRDRVRVGLVPELGLELVHATSVPSEPWREPDLAADVAADPARLGVWRAARDAAFRAWQARQRERDPATSRAGERERQVPIYAATGCGGTELFACRSYRHNVYCDPIAGVVLPAERLICRDGRAVHAIGDAIGCGDGSAIADPYACSSACSAAKSCELACSEDRCRLACTEAEVTCAADCFDAARAGCQAAGLDRFGMCETVAAQARELDDTRQSVAKTSAAVRARLDAARR
ncbi:MAG TPA: hypothetical protein VH143_03510 [Kofleriaceae bacterium]|jgi:hypothetical protein|nr:hypothetical protein [Kofleriaceae bacterium]